MRRFSGSLLWSCRMSREANEAFLRRGSVGGLDLGDGAMLVAVTEKRTKDELDAFVEVVSNAL